MFSCKNNLQFVAPLFGVTLTGHSNQAPKFLHQLFTIHALTICNLHFTYRPINIQRPVRIYSDIRHQRLQNLVWMFFPKIVFADFETAIHNAVTIVWPGLEVKACCFHLGQSWWRKIQSLGLSKQYGKEKLWGKSLLEENIRTVVFTTGGSLRLLRVGIFIQSFKLQASGTVFQLPARKWYWCRLQFSSACLARLYCIIIEDHKRMWVIPCPLQCAVLQCAS